MQVTHIYDPVDGRLNYVDVIDFDPDEADAIGEEYAALQQLVGEGYDWVDQDCFDMVDDPTDCIQWVHIAPQLGIVLADHFPAVEPNMTPGEIVSTLMLTYGDRANVAAMLAAVIGTQCRIVPGAYVDSVGSAMPMPVLFLLHN